MVGRVLLGRYQVTRFLAEGGMSRVFLARQLDQDRLVAVKVMDKAKLARPEFRDLLRRETRFMEQFRHPYAVALYDADLADQDEPYLVMEYVDGVTLADVLERHGRLDAGRVGRLLGQICAVLQAAHDRGLVYRDLKPDNIMVALAGTPEETIKLLDLGLATASGGHYFAVADLSGGRNALSGTPEYLCPEAILGSPLDRRSDLYSVGVMLFELLTGRRPFDRSTVEDTLLAHVKDLPPVFDAVGAADVPKAIQGVVYTCLAKFPAERPQSALELARRYEEALGEPIVVVEAGESLNRSGMKPEEQVEDVEETDPNAVVYRMTAWMPEQIAVMKLRGCLPDLGGEVVESAPGALRIRLARPVSAPPPKPGLWSMMGFGKRRAPAPTVEWVDMELKMRNADPAQPNQLAITAVLHPPEDAARGDSEDWRAYCDQVGVDLCAYLMARR